jgi:hypothetical protein
MKTLENYLISFIFLTLFSCGTAVKIAKNEKEEQFPNLGENEIKFYGEGDCIYFNPYMDCYNQSFSNGNFIGFTISENGGWESLGPSSQPLDIFTGQMAGVGRVDFISISKLNPNLIFTGSPDGGLFYSEDGCESWHSGGTDRLGPFIGVASPHSLASRE